MLGRIVVEPMYRHQVTPRSRNVSVQINSVIRAQMPDRPISAQRPLDASRQLCGALDPQSTR
jgi:hypothetical protein